MSNLPPDYIPPPVIYPRPRHKPIFDSPIPRLPDKRSASSKVGIVLAIVLGVPVGVFVLMLAIGFLLPADYGKDSKIADAKTRLEIVVGARSNHVSLTYGALAMKNGWVCGEYTYPGSAMHIFAFDGSRLMLDGTDNMLAEPVIYCIAEISRMRRAGKVK